jgi:SAM-dependent methyltransferase
MVPTLKASAPLPGALVLELGAGTGRYSVPMAGQGARLLAVDFSFHSLRSLAQRVEAGWEIGLVEADCTALRVQPERFDLVASTLVSNLPTADHRSAIYRLAATALRPGGKFVFSAHHFGWRLRWRGLSQAGQYKPGGIYRYLFRHREIRGEVKQHFAQVECRPVQIHVPLLGRSRLRYHASRLAERVWPLNRLGDLLLVAARKPVRTMAAFVVSHAPFLTDWMPVAEFAAELC